MRVLLTGGTGFIGGVVARRLRERGDAVVALVRDPARGSALEARGCDLATGDVTDAASVSAAAVGCDSVIHAAAVYRVGIRKSERPAMYETNVVGTERVLDAATAAGVGKIVYVSTVNVFGNTRGQVVDETHQRPDSGVFLSYYDETKYRAHQVALDRAAAGAPVVIAQPGGVYGPGDHSEIGDAIERIRKRKLPFVAFPGTGLNLAHVDDIAAGILLVLDRGQVGSSYVLGGEITTIGELIEKVAAAAGVAPPKLTMPVWAMKAGIPFGPVVGKLLGYPPNLAELIRAADGVTYWATDAKARHELGYTARGLDDGLRDTLRATRD